MPGPRRKTLNGNAEEARRRWLAGESPHRIAESLQTDLAAVNAFIACESAELDRGTPLHTLQRIEAELAEECRELEQQRALVRRWGPSDPETCTQKDAHGWLAESSRIRDDAARLRDQRIRVAELRAKLAGGLGVEPPRFVVEVVSRDADAGDSPAAAPPAPDDGGDERG